MNTALRRRVRVIVQLRLVVMLISVLVLGGLVVPDFLTTGTIQAVMDRATVVGFLALGVTPLLICGQIDLSIGSTMSMAGVSAIYFQATLGNLPAAVLGVLVGVLIGAVNAALVVLLKISSLVATLATLLIVASLALLVTNSQPLSSSDPLFGLGLTNLFLVVLSPRSALFVVAALLMFGWLRYTPSGRNMYAVGSNTPAALASGIDPHRTLLAAFLLSGLCSGVAGVLQALSTATGSPVSGSTLLIPAITAVVIGGTRLEGGQGSSLSTLGGVLALGTLTTLMEFQGVAAYVQAIYTGLLLIGLITLDRIFLRDTTHSFRERKSSRSTRAPSN